MKYLKFHFLPFFSVLFLGHFVSCQLDYRFYDSTCASLTKIVRYGVWSAIANETRMAASILRLHFHDCLVDGCEGSVMLDDTSSMKGEKNAFPNRNSVRGFEVIDAIKATAREAVYLAGGPFYMVPLGRRDGLSAKESSANEQLPSPLEPLENITAKFTSKGLDLKDVVVLSGAHTIGFAQCFTFKSRLFDFGGSGKPDPALDTSLLQNLQSVCPNQVDSDTNLAPLDPLTINKFDNSYYMNLVNSSGLLQSDQALMGNDKTASMVMNYSKYPFLFAKDFGASMVKMAGLGVLTGQNGQIRKTCRAVN
ncbi:hypothetical protein CRG98_043109 [Punica granatum]|uniref:Peroxidase n=1 Tax=Punica granatum TaxID=22663 RepID=A0A2I0HY95_PUNGR|nr:hypothetical protein CRG98_043109 [Punica granatum]